MPPIVAQLRPSNRAIAEYYQALTNFRAQEVEHEQAVRSAFLMLLTHAAKPFK